MTKENLDLINGALELSGGIASWLNVRSLYKDKQLKGYNVYAFCLFTSWGFWNLFYYPSLDQWLSFVGSISITLANVVWLYLAFYYKFKNNSRG